MKLPEEEGEQQDGRVDMCKAIQEIMEHGRRDGRAEGLAEGHEKGLVEGHEKGLVEGREKMVTELLRLCISVAEIKTTLRNAFPSLSAEQVNQIIQDAQRICS